MRGLIAQKSSRLSPREDDESDEQNENHEGIESVKWKQHDNEIIWTESDKKAQRDMLDELFLDPSEMTPFKPLFKSPEVACLLTLPPEEMGEKLSIMLSNLNLVAGLMLSGVMVSGLSPTDSTSFNNENDELLNNIKNILSAILISLNVNVVLFTTYLICQLAVEPPQNILRVVSRGGGLALYQYWTFASGFLVLAILCIANYLNSTGIWKWVSMIIIPLLLFIAQTHYFLSLGQMFPLVIVRWATAVCPMVLYTKLGKELQESAKVDKYNKQMRVMKHLGIDCSRSSNKKDGYKFKKPLRSEECSISTSMIESSFSGSNNSQKIDNKSLSDMINFLKIGLSSTSSQRLRDIAISLLKEDITLLILRSLLDHRGEGTQSLIQVLNEVDIHTPMTVGEKMMIARAVETNAATVTVVDCE